MAIRKFNSEEGFSVGLYPSIDVIDVNGNIIANDIIEYITNEANIELINKLKSYGLNTKQAVKKIDNDNFTICAQKRFSSQASFLQLIKFREIFSLLHDEKRSTEVVNSGYNPYS
jgi:NAD-dependent DNA ligase